ncbi:MAG: DNA-binding protein [Clostridiales bacterium]|nr:DNA-binding protein [Clostridiales bacterium]
MRDKLKMSLLLDFYGGLLTEKQRDISELYYNGDYSLSEIADDLRISRQGVRDSLVRAEAILTELEEKIGFAGKYSEIANNNKLIKNTVLNALEMQNADDIKASLRKILAIIDDESNV